MNQKYTKSQNTKDNLKPMLLHIDIGNQSLVTWANNNKYIIHSELIRYCEKLIIGEFDIVEAIMISNLADNVVFMVSEKNVSDTLNKAMKRQRGNGSLEALYIRYKKQCKEGTTKSEMDIQLRRSNVKGLEYLF